eukprot:6449669-Alexandrium_andersonii.AAC.1
MRLPFPRSCAQCRLAPSSAGTAAEPPGPEPGLGSPKTVPLTAAPGGALVRQQERAGSGRLCRPG